ncbi:MAG TPA: single-stranded DNA-binding protein [Anaerolineales bacterium]|nr:single-stranded DNA-binding protein [Anaerolineales bacterium]
MYQKIIIAGNLGRDPEMRYAPSGSPVTSFSVASSRKYTSAEGDLVEETGWYRVSAWNRLAEVCAEYLTKGAKVLVEGRLKIDPPTGGPRIWQDSDGAARTSFEVTAATVTFLSGKPAENGEVEGEDIGVEEEAIPF